MVAVHFLGDFAAVDLSGLLVGIAEALPGVAFTQAVSAVGFTAVADGFHGGGFGGGAHGGGHR